MSHMAILLFLALCLASLQKTVAFTPPFTANTNLQTPSCNGSSLSAVDESTLTEPEQTVYALLQDLHASKFSFRIVVVGNGAILESTNPLGPNMSLSQSPKSGANLVTFSSDDKSFELHLQTAAVSKVNMVEKQVPTGRTMRILRFVNEAGQSICSLILSEDSDSTAEWYKTMRDKYGDGLVV